MSLLAPSILAADFTRLGEEVQACQAAGADRIHVDVMDNHFVPNLTMGPQMVAACKRATSLFLEAHLMVERPDQIIPDFARAGADLITVHLEACPQLHRTVALVRQLEVEPGVGVNPSTPVELLKDILPEIRLALVMSVDPGFGGQDFQPQALGRVRRLRQLITELGVECDIELDGGIEPGNAQEAVAAGASVLVAGTAVFGAPGGAQDGVRCLLERMGRPAVRAQAG